MTDKLKDFLNGIDLPRKEEGQITAETMAELSNNKGDDDE